jgi:hypothetical protein
MALPDEKPLEGWKNIARYLGRGDRTAQRWEHKGLPVYRHELLGVIAYRSELDLWIANFSKETAGPGGASAAPDLPPPQNGVVLTIRRSFWTRFAATIRSWLFVAAGLAVFGGLTVTILESAYGLAILGCCLGAVVVILGYQRGPDTPTARSFVALYITAAMSYVSSASTMPEVQATIINAGTLPPSPAYVFVTGLRFIPLLVLVLGTWVALGFEGNAGFLARRGWEKAYWVLGVLMVAAELVGLGLTSGDDRIWKAAVPGRWTLIIGFLVVLAANLAVWIAAVRCFRQEVIVSYQPLFWQMMLASLVIAFASFVVDREHNRINQYYLDQRWPDAFRVTDTRPIQDISQFLRNHGGDEIGPDLVNLLMNDPGFRKNVLSGVFYKQNSDEPFQLTNRAVIFGYRPATSSSGHDRRPFVTIRFPKELADALEFRPATE